MNDKKILIASDHAGFGSKQKVVEHLKSLNLIVEDLGPSTDDRTDYPDYADEVCQRLIDNPTGLGVLVCGSGQGMAMRANKYRTIRAALCWNEESARLARQHNNANILCLGSRLIDEDTLFKTLDTFLKEEYEGGRHQSRVEKISAPTDRSSK